MYFLIRCSEFSGNVDCRHGHRSDGSRHQIEGRPRHYGPDRESSGCGGRGSGGGHRAGGTPSGGVEEEAMGVGVVGAGKQEGKKVEK